MSLLRFSCMGNSIPYSNLGYNVEKLLEIHIYRQKMVFWGQINCLLLLEYFAFCGLFSIYNVLCHDKMLPQPPFPATNTHTLTHMHTNWPTYT